MKSTQLRGIVDLINHPIKNTDYRSNCKEKLDNNGALVLDNFLTQKAIDRILIEADKYKSLAYYCTNYHNVYLNKQDDSLPKSHPRSRKIISSKGCITDDQVPIDSPLRILYNSDEFQDFLCAVLGEVELHNYYDSLSSINIHYAKRGQELGWHFDNSSFAITLLIQKPTKGGQFEYIRDFRYDSQGVDNYKDIEDLLDGIIEPNLLVMNPGSLVLFRGKESIHRVTPVEGNKVRILSVLAYNSEPNIALSEEARMTFYGRLK